MTIIPYDVNSQIDSFKEGPLKLLVTCFAEKSKVKVYVRNAKGLRGSCTGTIFAFDKQMNLILKNVNEEYIETEVHFKKQTLPDGTRKKRKRKTFVEVKKQRFISQLFIKGDSIVSICRLEK